MNHVFIIGGIVCAVFSPMIVRNLWAGVPLAVAGLLLSGVGIVREWRSFR